MSDKKNKKSMSSRRHNKIEKQKKKQKEIKKKRSQDPNHSKRMNDRRARFENLESQLKNNLSNFSENIIKESTEYIFHEIIGEYSKIDYFLEKTEELLDLERKYYYDSIDIIDNLNQSTSKKQTINHKLRKMKTNKQDLSKKINILLSDARSKPFQKIEEREDLEGKIKESVKKIMDCKETELRTLERKELQTKSAFIRWIVDWYEVEKNKLSEKRINEMLDEEDKKRIQKNLEYLFKRIEKFIDSNTQFQTKAELEIKQALLLKDRLIEFFIECPFEKTDLEKTVKKLKIDIKNGITENIIRKINTYQRLSDALTSGVLETFEEYLQVMIDSDEDILKRKILRLYHEAILGEDEKNILRIKTPPETCLTGYSATSTIIPSFSELEKLKKNIKQMEESEYRIHLSNMLYHANTQYIKIKTSFITALAELCKVDEAYNLNYFLSFAKRNITDIHQINKMIEAVITSPETSILFKNKKFTNMKNEEITQFLNSSEWTFYDGKTLIETLGNEKLEEKKIKTIVKNPNLFKLFINSEKLENILNDEELVNYLKKSEDTQLKKSFFAIFGLKYKKQIAEIKEQELSYLIQEIENEEALEKYLEIKDYEHFTKKNDIKKTLTEAEKEELNKYDKKEKILLTLSKIRKTNYYEVIIKDPLLFKKICQKIETEDNFDEELINLSYKKTQTPYKILERKLMTKIKEKQRTKNRIIIISGIMPDERICEIQEKFEDITIELYDASVRPKYFADVGEDDLVIYDVSHTGHSTYYGIKNKCQKNNADFLHAETSNKERIEKLIEKYAFE